eukprot:Skav220310  [mRNA]  locus=scaffold525:66274:66564:- [translate_table: standard]
MAMPNLLSSSSARCSASCFSAAAASCSSSSVMWSPKTAAVGGTNSRKPACKFDEATTNRGNAMFIIAKASSTLCGAGGLNAGPSPCPRAAAHFWTL